MSASPCGSCTLCCKILDVPQLGKAAGVWCSSCTPGQGCGAYEERAQVCREFECIWLQTKGKDHRRVSEWRRRGGLPVIVMEGSRRTMLT